jgi:hypothetical protein
MPCIYFLINNCIIYLEKRGSFFLKKKKGVALFSIFKFHTSGEALFFLKEGEEVVTLYTRSREFIGCRFLFEKEALSFSRRFS